MPAGPFTRTAGFYKNHPTITQQILNGEPGLRVCGHLITDVDVDHGHSALEAMCVSPHGYQRLHLMRQLVTAALNLLSGSSATFSNYLSCDVTCQDLDASESAVASCISQTDGFNESGDPLPAPWDPAGPADPTPCQFAGDTPCLALYPDTCLVP